MISRRQFLRFIGGLGALGASTAAYGFGEPVLRLRVARYDITPKQWPADFQLRIAVIADLHACDPWMSLQRIEAIVEHTNALNADIIVMLGDYVAGHRRVTRTIPAGEWADVLAGLQAPLGVHAILGNHDWWDDKTAQREGQGPTVARRALEAAGIPVYENDARRLNKDGIRSGSPGSAISWLTFRRAASAGCGASVSTISQRLWQKSPTPPR
jgi:predicted MPP superfamily phosphohydrolase